MWAIYSVITVSLIDKLKNWSRNTVTLHWYQGQVTRIWESLAFNLRLAKQSGAILVFVYPEQKLHQLHLNILLQLLTCTEYLELTIKRFLFLFLKGYIFRMRHNSKLCLKIQWHKMTDLAGKTVCLWYQNQYTSSKSAMLCWKPKDRRVQRTACKHIVMLLKPANPNLERMIWDLYTWPCEFWCWIIRGTFINRHSEKSPFSDLFLFLVFLSYYRMTVQLYNKTNGKTRQTV